MLRGSERRWEGEHGCEFETERKLFCGSLSAFVSEISFLVQYVRWSSIFHGLAAPEWWGRWTPRFLQWHAHISFTYMLLVSPKQSMALYMTNLSPFYLCFRLFEQLHPARGISSLFFCSLHSFLTYWGGMMMLSINLTAGPPLCPRSSPSRGVSTGSILTAPLSTAPRAGSTSSSSCIVSGSARER